MENRVVVITGASAGIGAALARLVAQRGARPFLVARREALLREVCASIGPPAAYRVADVSQRDEVKAVVQAALATHGHIDVWVNNAGRGISRAPSELTDADVHEMMQANAMSALYGMQEVLPHFKTRGTGHLINVSSMLGRVPFAIARSAYSASKHFLNSLTANFRMELRATHPGIQVSLVSPGVVATDFGLNALHGGIDSRALPFAQPVDEVASVIWDVIESRRAEAYTRPGLQQQVVDYFSAPDVGALETKPPFAPR